MIGVDRSKLPAVGHASPIRFPSIHKDRLKNRLALWSVQNTALPVVSFMLLLPVGSAADFEGYDGLAALTADMLDEGSGDRSAIDMNGAFAALGAQLDTDVSTDATLLTVTCLSKFAPRALSLLSDCLVRPRLSNEDFERVRQLRLMRLVQIRDMASAIADRAFMQLVYGGHPYGHTPLGTEEALRQIAATDVRAFHARAYDPAAVTLIASGHISPADFRLMAEEAFGSWTSESRQPLEDAALAPPPAEPAHRLALVNKAGAAQAEIRIGQVGVTRSTPEFHALIVLNMVLGGQFVSRLNMKLRQEKGLTYGARTSFEFRRGRGPFMLATSVQTDGAAEAVDAALHEIESIRTTRPPTVEEVELAKAALTRGYARNFETAEQVARAIAQLALYGLPDSYFDEFVPAVLAIAADDAHRAAVSHLDPGKLATALVGDAALVGQQLTKAGLGEVVPLLPRL